MHGAERGNGISESDIPLEILEHIFSFVPRTDLSAIRLVSRSWRDAAFALFFRTIRIDLKRSSRPWIVFLVRNSAVRERVRELALSYEGEEAEEAEDNGLWLRDILGGEGDDAENRVRQYTDECKNDMRLVSLLRPLSGMLSKVTSLRIDGHGPRADLPEAFGLASFLIFNCPSARHICVRDMFLIQHGLKYVLALFSNLEFLCTHDAMVSCCLRSGIRAVSCPWPFGPDVGDLSRRITTLSFRVDWAYRTMSLGWLRDNDPAFSFPALTTLVIYIERASEPQAYELTTHILSHVLKKCPTLQHISLCMARQECLPVDIVLTPVLRTHLTRTFTLALHFPGGVPEGMSARLEALDASIVRETPDARCSVVVAHDGLDISRIMPELYAKGLARSDNTPLEHSHFELQDAEEGM